MRQINLLPSELKPSKQFGIALRKSIKYLVIFFILYLVFASAAIGTIYYFDGKLKELTESKATLSAQVKSLSNVQTSVINIRDRVSKLETIKGRDFEITGLSDMSILYKNLPVNSKITDITISGKSVSFTVSAPDTALFIYIMDKLVTSELFNDMIVSGINYTKDVGYMFYISAIFR